MSVADKGLIKRNALETVADLVELWKVQNRYKHSIMSSRALVLSPNELNTETAP